MKQYPAAAAGPDVITNKKISDELDTASATLQRDLDGDATPDN